MIPIRLLLPLVLAVAGVVMMGFSERHLIQYVGLVLYAASLVYAFSVYPASWYVRLSRAARVTILTTAIAATVSAGYHWPHSPLLTVVFGLVIWAGFLVLDP